MEISRRLFIKILGVSLGTLSFEDYIAVQANKTLAALTALFFAAKPSAVLYRKHLGDDNSSDNLVFTVYLR